MADQNGRKSRRATARAMHAAALRALRAAELNGHTLAPRGETAADEDFDFAEGLNIPVPPSARRAMAQRPDDFTLPLPPRTRRDAQADALPSVSIAIAAHQLKGLIRLARNNRRPAAILAAGLVGASALGYAMLSGSDEAAREAALPVDIVNDASDDAPGHGETVARTPEGRISPGGPAVLDGDEVSRDSQADASARNVYTVAAGDTLTRIARAHNVAVEEIAGLNALEDINALEIGQKLRLPAAEAASPAARRDIPRYEGTSPEYRAALLALMQEHFQGDPDVEPVAYTVRRGDTLDQIAARHQTTTAVIWQDNPQLGNGHLIHPGDELSLRPGFRVADYKIGARHTHHGVTFYPGEDWDYQEVGIASWYGTGDGFDGKQTANGEIYDKWAMTAAHPTLPMPSVVEVTNLSNMRSVLVRINDRGPYHVDGRGPHAGQKRVIDLSRAAAEALGMVEAGTAEVHVRLLPAESYALAKSSGRKGPSPTGDPDITTEHLMTALVDAGTDEQAPDHRVASVTQGPARNSP